MGITNRGLQRSWKIMGSSPLPSASLSVHLIFFTSLIDHALFELEAPQPKRIELVKMRERLQDSCRNGGGWIYQSGYEIRPKGEEALRPYKGQ
ncbi:hypothetical protein H6P81_003233 [Aristolochia fimbriata]|uniref:Uncharacterized protein n=1 Tax=Aristolochia fimbriata TaxID=158543 RepID=A0AAV7FEY7_ARIFI|nr:hypothetical protein H6P81_003233 [Aristolochia fimbriata]